MEHYASRLKFLVAAAAPGIGKGTCPVTSATCPPSAFFKKLVGGSDLIVRKNHTPESNVHHSKIY